MFGRKKEETDGAVPPHEAREGAKNRPTPRRRDQEAARKRPLVVTDRKAARAAERQHRREAYRVTQQAMVSGDERHYPPRDQGAGRRFLRNWVDSRWNVGEFMLPVMLIVLALSFVRIPWVFSLIFVLVYGLIGVAIIDAWWMWRVAKRHMQAEGTGPVKGDLMYAVSRAFQMRRSRMPRPQVKRGEKI